MAEEFSNFLAEAKKEPLEEKMQSFGLIIEKIMSIVLRIPDLVDHSLANINQKISNLETQVNNMNRQISSMKTSAGSSPAAAMSPTPSQPTRSSGSVPPPPGGPPKTPPGPPGGPPGGPPRGPQARPDNPVSLRGAIMGELKELFSKRKAQQ